MLAHATIIALTFYGKIEERSNISHSNHLHFYVATIIFSSITSIYNYFINNKNNCM